MSKVKHLFGASHKNYIKDSTKKRIEELEKTHVITRKEIIINRGGSTDHYDIDIYGYEKEESLNMLIKNSCKGKMGIVKQYEQLNQKMENYKKEHRTCYVPADKLKKMMKEIKEEPNKKTL
jgi:hypothetical protein